MKKQLLTCLAFAGALVMSAQSTLVADFRDGTGNGDPDYLTLFNGKIYFQADVNNTSNTLIPGVDIGDELWILNPNDDSLELLVLLEHKIQDSFLMN